jgi:hypothetical protein
MLESTSKQKIESYIDKIIDGLKKDARKNIASGIPNHQVIDKITIATVNKFTPESKMILSSTYNMLMEKTLAASFFQNLENKATFYQADILKDLNSHFVFDVPRKIDYEESKKEIDKLIAGGVITVIGTGGVLSITLKSWIPVCMAVVIVSVMAVVLKNKSLNNNSQDINTIIDNYLLGVKNSIMDWIKTIEYFYDDKVKKIEKGMNA